GRGKGERPHSASVQGNINGASRGGRRTAQTVACEPDRRSTHGGLLSMVSGVASPAPGHWACSLGYPAGVGDSAAGDFASVGRGRLQSAEARASRHVPDHGLVPCPIKKLRLGRNTMGLPVYSIVVPLYDTARYLPALLDSLARQDGLGSAFSLECVFVNDSSPDDAGALAQEWLTRTGIDGQVIDQPQAGVSAARNNGLDHVTGQWIAFIDSDDFLSGGYILGVHRFLEKIGSDVDSVSLVSCNVARYFETDDRYDHAHPLRDKFNRGDRLYPLDEHPQFIQSQAASA